MSNDQDLRELEALESEMGSLFEQTVPAATSVQLSRMAARAREIEEQPRLGWWRSLRWMVAGAALSAAALLALALMQPGPTRRDQMVAANDVIAPDIAATTAPVEPVLVAESVGMSPYFGVEDEWTMATSFDLFYGPMPGDDEAEWDGLYDHLLADNSFDDLGF